MRSAALLGELHLRTIGSGMLVRRRRSSRMRAMPRKVIAAVDAGGLGLPDRDYYVKSDAKSVETRERYVAHVAKMFELLGEQREAAKTNAADRDAA